ncbi:MAG: metal-dependent hydrolase [Saprospiraceae bacterium]|nr:metal-dependent hydrolase [Saprospiraceae bacterium]
MDSLTQITLGAAVGEVVLGRRLGNRAMLWGAIGGTIPDLDVIGNFVMSELDALAFHRGITHSLLFAVVAGATVAYAVHRLYASGTYRRRWYKTLITGVNLALLVLVAFGAWRLGSPALALPVTILAGFLGWRLVMRYYQGKQELVVVPYHRWMLLFFLAFLTHILLDCFTAFGTQVFLPFSDVRIAFNTIAVADPVYTVPFLIMVVLAAIHHRSEQARRILTWTGIGLSSLYLVVTVWNKHRVDQIFSEALAHREITVERCRTSPTILNNLLWNCVAEGPEAFYVGLYSIRDSDPLLHVLNRLPKPEATYAWLEEFAAYRTLSWLSDGYLYPTVTDTAVILSDLRYGSLRDTITNDRDMVFSFITKPDHAHFEIEQRRPRPGDLAGEFKRFWDRVLGY